MFSALVTPRRDPQAAAALFTEMGGEETFVQLTRYLYRWYLDEYDFIRFNETAKHQLWLREIKADSDPEDKSRYLEVVFPATGVMVTLKKTDYTIPELRLKVQSGGYRINQLCRDTCSHQVRQRDYAVMDINIEALYERLFETRLERVYPDADLRGHLRDAALRQIAETGSHAATGERKREPVTLFIAPFQSIANEVWVFWEEGKLLWRFTSDIDLARPAVWQHDTVRVRMYDTLKQTVVSHEERPCDDRFATRDQIGRALYNCIILGSKLTVPPASQ